MTDEGRAEGGMDGVYWDAKILGKFECGVQVAYINDDPQAPATRMPFELCSAGNSSALSSRPSQKNNGRSFKGAAGKRGSLIQMSRLCPGGCCSPTLMACCFSLLLCYCARFWPL